MAKILLIEDEELNRDLLSRRLNKKGYQILSAGDAHRGLALARSESPDLILMDMGLPGMDGMEASRRLKGDKVLASIPVLGLSANASSSDREKALEAGCDDYDTKPIDFPRLIEKIEALLKEPHSS